MDDPGRRFEGRGFRSGGNSAINTNIFRSVLQPCFDNHPLHNSLSLRRAISLSLSLLLRGLLPHETIPPPLVSSTTALLDLKHADTRIYRERRTTDARRGDGGDGGSGGGGSDDEDDEEEEEEDDASFYAPLPHLPVTLFTLPFSLLPLPATYSSTHFDIFRELRPARTSRKSILRWLEGVVRTLSLSLVRSTRHTLPLLVYPKLHTRLSYDGSSSYYSVRSALPLSFFFFSSSFFFFLFLRFFCLSFFQGEQTERRERRIDSSFREVCKGGRVEREEGG